MRSNRVLGTYRPVPLGVPALTNFDFVRVALPSVYDDCAHAESYVISDPRSACFYARRAVEETVGYLYDVLSLNVPYRDDLAARIGDPAFKATVPQAIAQKLTTIRRIANNAVHENRQIRQDVSMAVLRELFHVVVWTA
jgi:type I restriction enzyme R subunit